MSRRSSTSNRAAISLTSEAGISLVKAIRTADNIEAALIAISLDLPALADALVRATDFEGITVKSGPEAKWDPDTKVLTVPAAKGDSGDGVSHLRLTSTTEPNGVFGVMGETDTYTFYGDVEETKVVGEFGITNGANTSEDIQSLGAMLKSTYDADGDGVVDNSTRLGGKTLAEVEASAQAGLDLLVEGLGDNPNIVAKIGQLVGEESAVINQTIGSLQEEMETSYATKMYVDSSLVPINESINTQISSVSEDITALSLSTAQAIASSEQAMTSQLSQLTADFEGTYASKTELSTAVATASSALAQTITALETNVNDNYASKSFVSSAISTSEEALAEEINTLTVSFGEDIQAVVTSTSQAIANNESALAQQLSTLTAEFEGNFATHTQLSSAIATSESATALEISELEASLGQDIQAVSTSTSQAIANNEQALALQLNSLVVDFQGSFATKSSLTTAVATATDSILEAVDTLRVDVEGNYATKTSVTSAIATETSARTSAIATARSEIESGVAGQIITLEESIAEEGRARVQLGTDLTATLGGEIGAAVSRLDSVETLAGETSTALSTLKGEVENPETGLSASYNKADQAQSTADGAATAATLANLAINDPVTGIGAAFDRIDSVALDAEGNTQAISEVKGQINHATTGLAATFENANTAQLTADGAASVANTVKGAIEDPVTGLTATYDKLTTVETTADNAMSGVDSLNIRLDHPDTGLTATLARADYAANTADGAATVASEVKGAIDDPEGGLLAAFSKISAVEQTADNNLQAYENLVLDLEHPVTGLVGAFSELDRISALADGTATAQSITEGKVNDPTTGLTAAYGKAFTAEIRSGENATAIATLGTRITGVEDNKFDAQAFVDFKVDYDILTGELEARTNLQTQLEADGSVRVTGVSVFDDNHAVRDRVIVLQSDKVLFTTAEGPLELDDLAFKDKAGLNDLDTTLIQGGHIVTDLIDANFLSTKQFRADYDGSSVRIGGQTSIPFGIYNDAEDELLAFDTENQILRMDASLGPGTLRTLDVFTEEVRAQLLPVGGTGGSARVEYFPITKSSDSVVVTVPNANQGPALISVRLVDYYSSIGSDPTTSLAVAPQWQVRMYKGAVATGTPIYTEIVKGNAFNSIEYQPFGAPPIVDRSFSINATVTHTDTTHQTASGADAVFTIRVDRMSTGLSYNQPRLINASVSIPLTGGGARALDQLNDTTITNRTEGQVLRMTGDFWTNSFLGAADITGLGSSATLNVGTTAGTVASGDDARILKAVEAWDWGDHAAAGYVKTDTLYVAGDGLRLDVINNENVFSLDRTSTLDPLIVDIERIDTEVELLDADAKLIRVDISSLVEEIERVDVTIERVDLDILGISNEMDTAFTTFGTTLETLEGEIADGKADLDRLSYAVTVEKRNRELSDIAILDSMMDAHAHRQELDRRILHDEVLIGTVVHEDKETGTITNLAFSYTDTAFSEAQILIDGVEASVDILTQRVTFSEDELESLDSRLLAIPGQITQTATSIVTHALAALEPAHIFNFYGSTQGWTAVSGTITSGSNYIAVEQGDIEHTALDYLAEDNPAIIINIERTGGDGWVGDVVVTFDDDTTTTFTGIIEDVTGSVLRNITFQGNTSYVGQVKGLRLVLGATPADTFTIKSIAIGKPEAAQLELEGLTSRVSTAESKVSALEGAIENKVEVATYENEVVKRSTLASILDAQHGYGEITSTVQDITNNDTIANATKAGIFLSGAEGTFKAFATKTEDDIEANALLLQDVITNPFGTSTALASLYADVKGPAGIVAAFASFTSSYDVDKGLTADAIQGVQGELAIERGRITTNATNIQDFKTDPFGNSSALNALYATIHDSTTGLISAYNQLESDLNAESGARASAITGVEGLIATERGRITANSNSIQEFKADPFGNSTALNQLNVSVTDPQGGGIAQAVNTLSAALDVETGLRANAIAGVQGEIDVERGRISTTSTALQSFKTDPFGNSTALNELRTMIVDPLTGLVTAVNQLEVDLGLETGARADAIAGVKSEINTERGRITTTSDNLQSLITDPFGNSSALNALRVMIEDPVTGLVGAVQALEADLDTESGIRANAITGLLGDLQIERARITTNVDNIQSFKTDPFGNSTALSELNLTINHSTTGLVTAVDQLRIDLTAETGARGQAIAGLESDIATERGRITNTNTSIQEFKTDPFGNSSALNQLNNTINAAGTGLVSAVTQLRTDLDDEAGTRASAITGVKGEIDVERGRITTTANSLQSFKTDPFGASTALNQLYASITDPQGGGIAQAVSTLQTDLTAEGNLRGQAVTGLQGQLDVERGRINANVSTLQDLQTDLDGNATAIAQTSVSAAYTAKRVEQVDASADDTAISHLDALLDVAMFKLGVYENDVAFAEGINQLFVEVGPTGAIATQITGIQAAASVQGQAITATANLVQEIITDPFGTSSALQQLNANVTDPQSGGVAQSILQLDSKIDDEAESRATALLQVKKDIGTDLTAVSDLLQDVITDPFGTSTALQQLQATVGDANTGLVSAMASLNTEFNSVTGELKARAFFGTSLENTDPDTPAVLTGILVQDDNFSTPRKVSIIGDMVTFADSTGAQKIYFDMLLGDYTFDGIVRAGSGNIGGWSIKPDLLKSADTGRRIELDATKNRISVFDSVDEKVAMGYLNNLPKNGSTTEKWGPSHYGFWIQKGNALTVDGDVGYSRGDWQIQNDASVTIKSATGHDLIRLGTHNGAKGLFLYDGLASGAINVELSEDKFKVGTGDNFLSYVNGNLSISGHIKATSGEFAGELKAATGTFKGSLSAATGDFSGKVTADEGKVGGWHLTDTLLKSAASGSRVQLDSVKNRVSVFDSTSEKVVMGYLGGLKKGHGAGDWTSSNYGFWVAQGDELIIDGDIIYESGDWLIHNDASVSIQNALGEEILRLGTDSGDKGLFLYDAGAKIAEFSSTKILVGDTTNYLSYDAGELKVKGHIEADSGYFRGVLGAGVVTADTLTAEGLVIEDEEAGGTRFTFNPRSQLPIHIEDVATGETLYSLTKGGEGYYKGSLAPDTVDAEALTDNAKKAINPRYLGAGERHEIIASGIMASGSTQAFLAPFATVNKGGRVILTAIFSGGEDWTSTRLTQEPDWINASYTIAIERSINNGAWASVHSDTLGIEVKRQVEHETGGIDIIYKGYSYRKSINYTDTVTVLSTNIRYRLKVTRTSGGTTGPGAGLRRTRWVGEKSAFDLNEITKHTTSSATTHMWVDKDSGYATCSGTVDMGSSTSKQIQFPSSFSEVYGVTLGFQFNNGTYNNQSPPYYYNLTNGSVWIRNTQGGAYGQKVSFHVTGRVDL